jgi:hypothetical protein
LVLQDYEASLHSYPELFFAEEERMQIEPSGKIHPDSWAHFIPGALYVILSTLMMFIAIFYIGSAEGHEYPDLQVGDEVNPRTFLGALLNR